MVVIYAKGRASNALRDYAASRGWDDGVWAVSEPAALLRAVRAGKVEIILASNLNGLARSSLELVELLREFVSRKTRSKGLVMKMLFPQGGWQHLEQSTISKGEVPL